MAKSAKQLKQAGAGEGNEAEPGNDGQADRSPGLAAPEGTPPAAKAATKPTRKRASGASAKKTASKPRKTATRKKAGPAETALSDDDIRLRAYFIAEKRSQNGGGGDSSGDWLEARRQLLAEAGGQP